MNMVLTGGLPSPPKALVSPGMLSPSGGHHVMPLNVHPFPPLSPQQQQQLIRPNPMAAAIAAASLRPSYGHSQSNPGLLSFLSPMNSPVGPGHSLGYAAQPGILGSPPCASTSLMGSPPALLQTANLVALPHTSAALNSPLPSPTAEDVFMHRNQFFNAHLLPPFPINSPHMIFGNMLGAAARANAPQHHSHYLINGNGLGAAFPSPGGGKRTLDDAFPGLDSGIVSPKRLCHPNSIGSPGPVANGFPYNFNPKSPFNI